MKRTTKNTTPSQLMRLEPRRDDTDIRRLERRLEDGYQLIEMHLRAGDDVSELEAFWLNLLRQYELLCDAAPLAA
jgi:hypothetical protein